MVYDFEPYLQKIKNQAHQSDHADQAPVKEITWLAESGALKVVLPGEMLDFKRGNTIKLLQLLKKTGEANLSIGRIYEGHINALYLIHLYGSEFQKHYYYQQVIDHHTLLGVWNTQAENGIQFNGEDENLALTGCKTFASGASLIKYALITGNIDTTGRKGWQMMLADLSELNENHIDTSAWKPLGMKASGSYTVDFAGYHVKESELLGQPGDYLKQPYFNGGAIRFAAVHLGGAQSVFNETLNFLKSLNRTDDPFQKARIAKMITGITAGDLWLKQAGEYYDEWHNQPDQSDNLIAFANMTRTAIEEICLNVMDDSNRCVGARGLMFPHELERIFRDLTYYLRQPAPDATRLSVADFFINSHQ